MYLCLYCDNELTDLDGVNFQCPKCGCRHMANHNPGQYHALYLGEIDLLGVMIKYDIINDITLINYITDTRDRRTIDLFFDGRITYPKFAEMEETEEVKTLKAEADKFSIEQMKDFWKDLEQ